VVEARDSLERTVLDTTRQRRAIVASIPNGTGTVEILGCGIDFVILLSFLF
jgi:hypothetical protein